MPVSLRIIIYPIFAVLSFVIFVMLLFPFSSIKGRIESEVERNLGGIYKVEIGDLAMAPLTGMSMKKLQVTEKAGKKQLIMKVDQAKVHVDLLPLLWGAIKLGYDVKADGGRVYGRLAHSGDEIHVEADIKNFNLNTVPWLKVKYGIGLSSDVDGAVDMMLYPKAPLRNNGSVKLQVQNLKMDEANIMNVLPLPALSLATPQGKSAVDIVMNRGSIEIRSMNLKGGDLDLGMGGKIYLAQRVNNFRFNLRGKLGFGEKVAEALPLLMIIEKQKGPDGLYPLTVTGQVRKPNIRIGDFRVPI